MYIYIPTLAVNTPIANTNTGANQLPALRDLQLGQLLTATVQSPNNKGLLQLLIGGQTLQAQTTLTPSIGERLQLQVMGLQSPVTLKVLDHNTQTGIAIQQGMRQALPQQNSLAPLLANLAALQKSQHTVGNFQLPSNIVNTAQTILQQLPTLNELSQAKGLEQAFKNSGLFFEKQLRSSVQQSTSSTKPDGDFKGNLLKLWQSLVTQQQPSSSRQTTAQVTNNNTAAQQTSSGQSSNTSHSSTPTTQTSKLSATTPTNPVAEQTDKVNPVSPRATSAPPMKGVFPHQQMVQQASLLTLADLGSVIDELFEQVTASLARVQLHQLASVPTEAVVNPNWLVEIPLKHQEQLHLIQMQLEQENADDQDAEGHVWRVKLAFDLENLGPMYVDLRLQGHDLSAHVWAEQPSTKTLIERELAGLKQQLEDEGVNLSHYECKLGHPPKPSPPKPDNLVDIKV